MQTRIEPFSERLAQVRRRIERAAARAGRDPSAVTLVVVTKEAPDSIFDTARAAGVRDVGESRVQQAERRHEGRADDFRWHLVGHLQGNKARRAVRLFDVLHGVDSVALLQRVDEAAAAFDRRPEVLLQVNVSGEATKHGLPVDELPAALQAAGRLSHARVTGLMTMAPESEDPEAARPHFRALSALRDRHGRGGAALDQLSMGMSDDFEVAVEEGATLVRIGRLLVRPEGLRPDDAVRR
jgi:pyridoxal phosphate enzyme (YggS family)